MTVCDPAVDLAREEFIARAAASPSLADVEWSKVVGVSAVPYDAVSGEVLFGREKGGRYRNMLNMIGGKVKCQPGCARCQFTVLAQLFDEIFEELRMVPDMAAVDGHLVLAAVLVPCSRGRWSLVTAIPAPAFKPAMADYGAELLSAAKRLDVDPPGRFREMKNVVWVPLSADSRDYRLSAYALAIWPLLRPALQELPHPPPTVPAEAVDALAG